MGAVRGSVRRLRGKTRSLGRQDGSAEGQLRVSAAALPRGCVNSTVTS